MDLRGLVVEIIEDIIESGNQQDIFLIDVKTSGSSKTGKIKVIIDNDRGVTIDQCAQISRKLGAKLEELDPLENRYILEVSSPGLDEPLLLKRQYQKNLGKMLHVSLNNGKILEGRLESVTENDITINIADKKTRESKSIKILLTDIKKSNIIVSFK